MQPRLVIVQTEPFGSAGDRVQIVDKTLTGLTAYARSWPGETVVIARPRPIADSAVQTVSRTADLPFNVELVEDPAAASAVTGADALLAMHQPSHAPLMARGARNVVWFAEFPLAERILTASIGASVLDRARSTVGWLRQARLLRRMITESAGLQSNGYPSHLAYGPLSPNPMLYFDTRVRSAMIRRPGDESRRGSAPTGALRLGFSGRHIRAKGADHAIELVRRLDARGAAVTMDVFGEGELTAELRRRASALPVRFHGSVPFDEEWVPYVREHVDVMVLPHIQGDPSGTYLESAALGVPVLGFANRAFAPLVERHGVGWAERVGDDAALEAEARRLLEQPTAIPEAGARGIAFMEQHTFESEFAQRMRHIREIADV